MNDRSNPVAASAPASTPASAAAPDSAAAPRRAATLLTLGMIMSGTIGYFVVQSGAPPLLVVFWRCLLGAGTLLVLVMSRSNSRAALRRAVTSPVGLWVALSGALLVGNWTLIFTAYSYRDVRPGCTLVPSTHRAEASISPWRWSRVLCSSAIRTS